MTLKTLLVATAMSIVVALPGQAKELKFAFQGTLASFDPYNLNESFQLGYLGNIFDDLIRRGPGLEIEPALATKWEIPEPTRWRFHLRKGVKFHDGSPFTADDVVFSADRVRAKGSDLKTRIADDVQVVKIDDHTVDFNYHQAEPHPARRMGHVVHHVQGVGREARRR
jgi:peptide/nickel transport system substrate-binding protein